MKTWSVIENGILEFNHKEITRVFIIHTIICLSIGFALGYYVAFMQY